MSQLLPERLDLSLLPALPIADKQFLPSCPAIYFVLNRENVVLYIGRANALHQRWKFHHRIQAYKHVPGVRIAWLSVSDAWLLPRLEDACIAYFHPRDNGSASPTGGYRLQIFVPRHMQAILQEVAHRKKKTVPQLTLELIYEKLHEYPEYQHLRMPERRGG